MHFFSTDHRLHVRLDEVLHTYFAGGQARHDRDHAICHAEQLRTTHSPFAMPEANASPPGIFPFSSHYCEHYIYSKP
ncbi:hypothetical protein ACFYNY_07060 [Streptomyces sp. NPDC006530]|uniref:hypothetical protein n=1 Tax=Streptomyces sp. NPDC006530 TaxID=3364750 RepID=UPI00369F93CC